MITTRPGFLFLMPAEPGMVVRDPRSRVALPDEGKWVPEESFWIRRVLDGSAKHGTPPAPPAAELAKKPAASSKGKEE